MTDQAKIEAQMAARPYRWPTNDELAAAFPSQTLAQEMLAEMVRDAEAAFAAGAEYVSLTMGGREVGRIYPDGGHWSPPL